MYNEGSSPTLRNLIFRYNSAYNGGAMYITGASPVGENIAFIDNIAVYTGGAIHIQGVSYPVFTNCLIARNLVTDGGAGNGGGGIINHSTGLSTFINTTLVSNIAANRGGGVYNTGNVNFRNSVLWGNQANASDVPGDQVFNGNNTVLLEYCCYSNNPGDMNHVSIHISYDPNCITTDPLFADAPNGDFRLFSTSPCADAGNDSYNTLLTDIRGVGFGRKLLKTDYTQTGTIDIGAYEYNSNTDPIGCANPTSGGTIAGVQTLCYGEDPVAFTSSNLPAGYNGTLEYKWQSSTTGSGSGFIDVAGAATTVYDAPPVTQTTWYRRLARVDCEADWSGAAPSNVLVVTVTPLPAFSYTKTDNTCFNGGDGTITITASGGSGSGYQYSIDDGANWQSANQFTGLSSGGYLLKVKDGNGCVQTYCVP